MQQRVFYMNPYQWHNWGHPVVPPSAVTKMLMKVETTTSL